LKEIIVNICIFIATKLRFKLPRNTYYFCSRNNVGNLTQAGLPNIEGYYYESDSSVGGFASTTGVSGALYSKLMSNAVGKYSSAGGESSRAIGLDASLSNSIYGNSSTVQPLSVNCYLEFYIN